MVKKSLTIMVLEDEDLLLRAIAKQLQVQGIDAVSCRGADQAFDYLQKIERLPDVIWLDYYLGDGNGLAFMQTLKQNAAWAQIPVVIISNSASHDKVTSMLALGAKKYILKAEYRLDEIIEIIRELVEEDQANAKNTNS